MGYLTISYQVLIHMGTRNYVSELEYSDAKGLDTTSPENLMAPGYVREALNINIGSTGGYVKRDGFQTENTLDSGMSIRQAIEFKNSDNQKETLFYLTNDSSSAKISSTTQSINTAIGATNRPSFAQINDSLFIFDGSKTIRPQVYEYEMQNKSREMGIEAPSAAPLTNPIVGGSLEEGQYVFAYTFAYYYKNVLIAESTPSPVTDSVATALNNQVQLTVAAFPNYINPELAHLDKKIRIFRTVVNGSVLFFEKEEDGSHTSQTLSSRASDFALQSEQISIDNTRLFDYGSDYRQSRFPVVVRNRLLVFHKNKNKGRFSKLGFNGPLPESFPIQNEFLVEGQFGSGDAVVGAGQIKGIPIVLKERSIGRLEEIGIPDLGRNEDSVTYIYREISQYVGAVSHFAQTQVFDELIFLGRDNVYATDGQNVRPIAKTIQDTIRKCNFSGDRIYKISAINDTKYKRIYIQVFRDLGAANPNLTLVGDYQQYPEFRWTVYGEGNDAAVYPGISAGCFWQSEATANGGLDLYFGNSIGNGKYYKMNTGYSDEFTDGTLAPIFMKVVSRPYMFGQPMVEKLFKNARIFVEAATDTYKFEFCSIFNLNSEEEFCVEFEIAGTGTVWDDYDWAPSVNPELIWSGPALQEKVYDPHRKAKTMQLVFKQTEFATTTSAPLTLLGWGVSGSIFSGI